MSRVLIRPGALADLGAIFRAHGLGGRAHIISDERVYALYGAVVERSLAAAGYDPAAVCVPAAEQSKSLAQAARLYDWLIDRRAERSDVIVALGGGMVGDLAGFVAATFLRGLALVQVPTTLLGQIDSAIGGKVGVNHPRGKNLIGAFHPAAVVVIDPETLRSLSRRELASGWAEAVKYAMILDPDLLTALEEQADRLLGLEMAAVVPVIERCVQHKLAIVGEDEREQGRRIILNYGHTLGHALEAATDYAVFLHGEAVAIGMMGEAWLSQRLGFCAPAVVERQARALERFGLPLQAPAVPVERVLGAIALDKKSQAGAVRWVLLEDIGRTRVTRDVPGELVRAALAAVTRSGVGVER
jgi:3-dehydroquinate synthase